jgi:Flp pilus assembly protein TadB
MQNLADDAQLKVEQLQGEIRLIKNQTSKATIDLSLRMAGVAVPSHGEVNHPGLGSAWAHAIAGFFGVVFAVVVGLGYLIPIAIVVLIAWFVFRRLRRRNPAFVDD